MLIYFLVSTQDEVNIIIPILQMRKLTQGQTPSMCQSQDSVQAIWPKPVLLTPHFQEWFYLFGSTLQLLGYKTGGPVGTSSPRKKSLRMTGVKSREFLTFLSSHLWVHHRVWRSSIQLFFLWSSLTIFPPQSPPQNPSSSTFSALPAALGSM